VSPDLFRDVIAHRPSAPASRFSALPVSIAAHVVALVAAVAIPLLASDVLPAVRSLDVEWTPVVLPPPPPPAPVAAARRAVVEAIEQAGASPVEAPAGIGRERLTPPEALPDAAAPQRGGSVPGAGLPAGLGPVIPDTPPPVRTAAPVRVSALVSPPVRIRQVSPVYPETARLARVEGLVVIEAVIGATGDVVDAKIIRSTPLLDDAALTAVRQWKYTPTLLNGVPVPVVMTVTVTFTLR
jgi:periplasmic protein TonB